MDIFASNKRSQQNKSKWEALHKKSADESVRTTPSYAIKRIYESLELIQTQSITVNTLEIGCGFGRNLHYLITHGFSDNYVGIDQTDIAISKSKELLSDYQQKGIVQLMKANAAGELPFPDAHFDCIFDIMSAITFIPDEAVRVAYFNNVVRLLKPGGAYFFLAVSSQAVFNDKVVDATLDEPGLFKRKFDNMIEKAYSAEELKRYLAGLSVCCLDVVSEHTRAFGDEKFERENGFWFGCFTKEI